jgi:DNA-binding IclR family transcriptional regulator
VLGDERVCVAELLSHERIRMESGVGSTYPLYAGAAGKAMLAWLPERIDPIASRLTAVGPATITDEGALRADLETIQARGYALSESEVVSGAASLAVPVFGMGGAVIAAINVVGPAARVSKATLYSFRSAVMDEAAALMGLLASPGPPRARS